MRFKVSKESEVTIVDEHNNCAVAYLEKRDGADVIAEVIARALNEEFPSCEELPCEEEGCQECCQHNEFDHNICLDCGREFDVLPGYDEDYGSER